MFDLLNSPWRQLRPWNRTALPVLSPLRLGYMEAGLNGLSSAVTAPLIVPFAVTLGALDWQIGVVTALPLLGMNLVQVPASRLHTRWGNPPLFLLLAGGLGRLAWLALAISMLLGAASYPLLLAAVTAAAVSSGLQTPVWTAFLGQQVPEERRGPTSAPEICSRGPCLSVEPSGQPGSLPGRDFRPVTALPC